MKTIKSMYESLSCWLQLLNASCINDVEKIYGDADYCFNQNMNEDERLEIVRKAGHEEFTLHAFIDESNPDTKVYNWTSPFTNIVLVVLEYPDKSIKKSFAVKFEKTN